MAVTSVKQPKPLGPRKEKVNKMMIIRVLTNPTKTGGLLIRES